MVEIKELVVRAIVVEDGGPRPAGARGAVAPAAGAGLTDEARQLLIEDCVRQVLAIMERQTER